MHLAYAARLISRKLPLILLLGLLGLGAGLLASHLAQSYTTTAYLSMEPAKDQQGIRAVDPERFFQTQSQLVMSDDVINASAKALNGELAPEELREVITLGGGGIDDVLQVTVTGKDKDQSWARAEAVLKGIKEVPQDEIITQLLWTSDPAPAVIARELALGGLLGGLVLGTLATLLAGAVRRPVLDPRFVQVRNPRVAVYPRFVSPQQAKLTSSDALEGWVQANNPERLPLVGAGVDDAQETQRLLAALPTEAPAAGAAGRLLVHVATSGKVTEKDIDDAIAGIQGSADRGVLLLTEPNPAEAPVARRLERKSLQ